MTKRPNRGATTIALLALVLPFASGRLLAQAKVLIPPGGSVAPPVVRDPATSAVTAPGGIVAIVGDEVVTQAELDRRVLQRRSQLADLYPAKVLEEEMVQLTWYTLESMVSDKMVLQQVRMKEKKSDQEKKFVEEAEVDAAIHRRVEFLREKNPAIKTADDVYRIALESEGLSRGEFRRLIRERLEVDRYLFQEVLRGAQVYVSPAEARVYYRAHIDDFKQPVSVSFREILVPLTSPDSLARKKAIDEGLEAGEPFIDLARTYSQEVYDGDPDAAGRLWQKSFEDLKTWHKPIPDVLRKLKPGQVSRPVPTRRGIHYFYMEKVVEGEPRSYSEVQDEIRQKLRQEREDRAIRDFLADLRERLRPEIFIPRPPGVLAEPGERGRAGAPVAATTTPAAPGAEE